MGPNQKLKISTDENFDQTRVFVGLTISRAAFEAIVLYTAVFYTRNAQLFQSRLGGHRIRDCHGDLHLEHVHLAPKDRFRRFSIGYWSEHTNLFVAKLQSINNRNVLYPYNLRNLRLNLFRFLG